MDYPSKVKLDPTFKFLSVDKGKFLLSHTSSILESVPIWGSRSSPIKAAPTFDALLTLFTTRVGSYGRKLEI